MTELVAHMVVISSVMSPVVVSSPVAEQLAEDLELFSHHASHKSVNMKDVILSAHRNKNLVTLLRTYSYDLKAKEPQFEKQIKKASNKEDKAGPSDAMPWLSVLRTFKTILHKIATNSIVKYPS